MTALESKLESLLFASTRPLTAKKLADLAKEKPKEVEAALKTLAAEYNARVGGVALVSNGNEYQLTTSGANAKVVAEFLKEEMTGELTRPQLETLTIICYRAPATKIDIETIRGINCSLILRNLLIRGLIEEEQDAKLMTVRYRPSVDLLRFLGVSRAEELPDYERLRGERVIDDLLKRKEMS